MPKLPINYSKTIIYKIVNILTGEVIYVGSTTEFSKRKYHHKNNTTNEKTKAYNFNLYQVIRQLGGWEKVLMVMVDEYTDCTSNMQKIKREREWFDELMPSANVRKPGNRIPEYKSQYDKAYNTANKEHISEVLKEWRAKNENYHRDYMRERRLKLNLKTIQKDIYIDTIKTF